ncbi:protein PNS1 [Carica papaya]|uniref:protein PNS1 n=1 Tax=Carica papaya TaxID=3649 RepID=UPI000B8CCEE8|nr:protein PNS1 [Carica papaya]
MISTMSDSHSISSSDSASVSAVDQNVVRNQRSGDGNQTLATESRHWRDVFWLGIFILHLIGLGFVLAVLGLNRFKKSDRLNIDRYTNRILENHRGLTENYWPLYAAAGGVGTALGWTWLVLLGSRAKEMIKVSVHILTTYLAVVSVLCFWCEQFFWGVAFATGAALQFLYIVSVIDRYVMTCVQYEYDLKMRGNSEICHMVVVLFHCFWISLLICYGSLFTAAIRTLRWEIRGFRSKIGGNECLLCCVDFLFHLVETLVRFFNKYAYVQIAVYGKGFNRSARDAWELFQSTGVEALVAYDCSGAVLLMGTIFGGLITGTCSGVWAWIKYRDRMIMVGSTAMLMGMVLVGLAMVVVESAVTSIYICYAEDPLLIHRWDTDFFNQMSETLHQRLQHRSARAREVLTHNQLDDHMQESIHI